MYGHLQIKNRAKSSQGHAHGTKEFQVRSTQLRQGVHDQGGVDPSQRRRPRGGPPILVLHVLERIFYQGSISTTCEIRPRQCGAQV